MADTKIADVIVPEVFAPYVSLRTKELSAFFQSGILSVLAENAAPVGSGNRGGDHVTMPYWDDLYGESETLSDVTPLSVNNITAGSDVAVLHARGKAWGVNELAAALSGGDPMGEIADKVAKYWNRDMQKTLIASLNGAFASPSMSGNVSDISAGANPVISGEAITDAFYLLGDASESLTAMAMHSATHAVLVKQNLIEYIRDADGKMLYSTYMGKRVIIDDGMPVVADVYTTYLFGAGAVGYRDVGAPTPVETDRDSLQGTDVLITRKHYLMHPRGIKWAGPAGLAPNNAGLETATNWARSYEPKQVRIVAFKHKIK